MPLLTADLCEPLLELIRCGEAQVDGVEVGPWYTPREIAGWRARLPGLPFYYHGAGLIARVGLVPGTLKTIRASVSSSGSPWVSMHITLLLPGLVFLMLRYGLRVPRPNPEQAARRLTGQAQRLARAVRVPVILENNDPLPFPGCEFEVQPERIRKILDATGCALLLDTGHARIAAERLGMPVEDYLARLPLERAVQVHASGPRRRAGRLIDAHEPLQEEDYRLLAYVLERTTPQVVTLEYIRERAALREQLGRMRAML